MRPPAGVAVRRGVARWGLGGAETLQTSNIVDRLERVGHTATSVGATYDFPFFNPLETKFQKVVFTKHIYI